MSIVTVKDKYQVVITQENCTTTSECMYVIVGVKEYTGENHIILFPNPAHDVVNIRCQQSMKNASIEIKDMSGKTIHAIKNISGSTIFLSIANYACGIYLIELKDDGYVYRKRLVKE